MKTAGLSALALTVILTANYLGRSISRRVCALEYYLLLIQSFKTYIGFSKMPLTRIIRELEKEEQYGSNSFLTNLESELCRSDFYESWCRCVRNCADLPVNGDDISLLCSFAQGLGTSDVNGQLENCEMYINLLSARIERLRPQSETRMKLFNSLGVLAAGLAVIILI